MALAKQAFQPRPIEFPTPAAPVVDRFSVRQVVNSLGYTRQTIEEAVNRVPGSEQARLNQCAVVRELLSFTLTDLLGLLPEEVQEPVRAILEAHDTIVHRSVSRGGQ